MTIRNTRFCDYCNTEIDDKEQRREIRVIDDGADNHDTVKDCCYKCFRKKKL